MGGGDLNLKKSWHPQTMKNQERVWKAEQADAAEKRKLLELQQEIQNERNREELKRIGQSSGILAPDNDKKLEWMYKGPESSVNREDYLLGKQIDRKFEKHAAEEKEKALIGVSVPKNHVEHECIPFSIRAFRGAPQSSEQVDIQRKLMEDPLMMIQQREMEKRKKLLENPVKLKEIHRLLQTDSKLKKVKKKSKKSKKSKSSRHSSGSDSEDLDKQLEKKYKRMLGEKSGGDLDKMLEEKYKKLSSELDKINKKHKRDKKDKKSKKKNKKHDSDSNSDSNSSMEDDKRSKRISRSHSRDQKRNQGYSPRRDAPLEPKRMRNYSPSNERWGNNNSRKNEQQKTNRFRNRSRSIERYNDRRRSKSPFQNRRDQRMRTPERRNQRQERSPNRFHSNQPYRRDRRPQYGNNTNHRPYYGNNNNSNNNNVDRRFRQNDNQKYRYRENVRSRSTNRSPDHFENPFRRRNESNDRNPSPLPEKVQNEENRQNESHFRSRSISRSSSASNNSAANPAINDLDEEEYEQRKRLLASRNFGLVTAQGQKIELKNKHEPVIRKSPASLAAASRKPIAPTTITSRTKLSEAEKAFRLKEMQENVKWVDIERTRNIERSKEEAKREAENESKEQFDSNYMHKQLHKAFNTNESVESRIKSKLNTIQRSSNSMNSNFTRR